MEAALIHDWLYSTKIVGRSVADKILKLKLEQDGAGWFRRHLIWLGVRAFGKYFGWPDTQEDINYMRGLYADLAVHGIETDKYQFPGQF